MAPSAAGVSYPPPGGAPIAGPFADLAVGLAGEHEVCAVGREDHRLDCWLGGKPITQSLPPGARTIAASSTGLCTLQIDGRVFCQGWGDKRLSQELPGTFRAFSAGGTTICGIDASAGRDLRCWHDWERWSDWSPAARVELPLRDAPWPWKEVAVGDDDGCALEQSGRIACWSQRGKASGNGGFAGLYRALAGSGPRRCAITSDGRVECNRGWP